MIEKPDLIRMRHEYEDRNARNSENKTYSRFNPGYLYSVQHLNRDVNRILKKYICFNLFQQKIVEIGCGSGNVLLDFLVNGANPSNLFGIDFRYNCLPKAKNRIPKASILNANGEYLPFISSSFDLVIQYTAFSSILDETIRQKMAEEMLRVLKPNGIIIWYDFWINPKNHQTVGIRLAEIKRIFTNCKYDIHKITLAPPITRKIVPFSWILAEVLESIKILNTHYLVFIRK